MKANFNIEKDVRNSHSINALSVLRKLQSIGLLLCALLMGSLQVWGADEVYKTAKFGTQADSGTSSNYTSTWTSSYDGFDVSVANGNTNGTSWSYVKFGRKSYTSVGTIITDEKIDKAVTKVVLTMSAITASSVNSIKLYTSSNGSTWTEAGTYTKSSGAQTVTLASPTANLYYKIEFDCASGSGNGFITVTQVDYYIASGPATYTITYAVSPVGSGSITGGESPLASGATKSLTATPNSGYKFSSWSVSGTGSTLSSTSTNPTTLTVGTAATTVTANFAAVSYVNYRTLCTPASDPSITVSPASITNLDYIVGQGPSEAQNITLGGSNLTASITITAPTNFEVSTDGGSTYGDSRTVTQTGGEPDVTTVKVRLKADRAVNTYGSSNVTFESTGATTQNVAVTGHVLKPTITATPNPVSWSTSVGVAPSTTSVTVTGVNMKANITAVKGGTNASDFTISPSSITQTAGSASGSITITYTGAYNAVTTKTATLTLSSTDADDVVVNITFNVINDPNLYFLTDLEDIGPKDKVIIVSSKDVGGASEVDYALKNATTTSTYPPDAVDVEDMIAVGRATLSYSGTDLQWNINYNSVSGEFTINRDGDDDVFLYCIDNNKGLSVGTTGTNNAYVIDDDYIKSSALTRYLGVYNDDDWRTYGTTGGNIADQTFTFYVQKSTDPYVTLGSSFTEFTYEYNHGPSTPQSFTVSGEHLSANLVVTAPSNYQVCKTIDGTYTNSVSFTPSTGTVSEQTVYIRLVAGLSVGEYDYAQSSGLSVTSTGADAVKAALEGSVTPETFTVTATCNNGSYGSVSPASQNTSTTATITATPESGYRVISGAGGYTVTSGTATVVNNGNNTFTVTPTTDCTVQINFEAIVMRTVSWNVNGNPYSTYTGAGTLSTSAEEGAKWSTLTLPDNPADNTLYAGCERTKFVGWSASPLYGDGNSAPSDLFKTTADDNADSHTISGNTTFYAVFAKGSGDGWQKVTSTPADWCGDYLLVYEASSSSVYVWNGTTDASNYVSATPDEGIITKPSGAVEITIEHFGVTSNYAIKAKEGTNQGKYFKGNSSNGFTLEDSQQNTTIGDVTDMGFTFTNSSSYMRYNTTAGQTRFRYYKQSTAVGSSYKEICLYEPAAAFTDYLTQCCSLEPVTNLHVSASTANSVTLAWTLPADMTGITKFQVVNADNGTVVKDGISTSATSSSISSLTECNTYRYKVVSYSSTCTTSTSAIEVQPYGAAKTVNFNYNGGNGSPASFTTTCSGNTTTLPTPDARDGYTFLGWWSAQNGGDPVGAAGASYTVSGNTTIWAHWAQNHTLTMATDPAAVSSSITSPRSGAGTVANKYAGEVITVTVTEPAHYDFVRWQSSNGGTFASATSLSTTFTMPNNATTVTAVFEAEAPRVVTWSDNGSTTPENVQDGETTTFPALVGCDTYVAVGWVEDNSNTFTSETLTKPGTIYAAETTTPAITGDVTYKAVYRHKYYTNDAFENGTTDGEAYYLYATYSGNPYYKCNSAPDLTTSTDKDDAKPIYLEKVGGSYYIREVATDKYFYGNSGSLAVSDNKSATDAYKWTFSTPSCSPDTKGDYKIVNEADKASKTLLFNSGSGKYIKEYSNVNDCNASYYNFYLEPAYYYKYSPTKACYEITVSSNDFSLADFYTIDGSHKLDGTILTVKVNCGKTISSWSFTSGTASLASGDAPEYLGMEGDKEVYRFTIIPETDATIRINFGNGPTRTISFLDGATNIGQTKTTAITDKRDCGSYDLPAGYSTESGSGGTCTGWTFDGWTATNYTYGQMGTPSDIVAAGTSQDVHGDKTWYAVYHKTFAAGAYFKIKYGDYYIADYGSNQFNTTTTEADGLMFQLEDGYLYYIDKTTRAKKWIYYAGPSGQNVTVSDAKPTSNLYKTTFTEDGGVYDIVCNSKHLKLSGDNVKYLTTASGATKPNASAFTAYYPKTDCTIEYVTITYDAGAGNSCSPASASVESGATISLPVEGDITYDNTDWTFVGWSESVVTGVVPGAPADLIAGGGSYSTFTNVTLHAVYSQVPPDGTFDNTKGGKYIIWGEDGGTNYYARSNGQTQGKLSNTLSCSEAAIFEFVETETAGQYKIHISGEAKYLAGQGCGHSDTDFKFENAEDAPVWTVTETAPSSGIWKVISTCNDRGFIFETSGSKQFGHYSTNNPINSPSLYKFVHIGQCDDYYTTNPNKTLNITGNVMVTSTNGRMIMAKDQLVINAGNIGSGAPVTITSNSSDVYFSTTRAVNISKAEKPTTSVTINADGDGNITAQTVYVHYMPSVATNGIEEVLVTVTSPEKTVDHTIKVRHLPATFAIAAKVGTAWYALTGNMHGAANPNAIQIDVDESTWTAYAPDTCAYQIWPVKTTSGSGDRYALQGGNAYGERVRFSAVNNETTANAGLWANNSSTKNTIDNDAAITAISSDPAEAYEWKIAATEVSGTWKYTLQTDQSNNTNKLNIHRDENLIWGTYSDGQAVTSDIYLIPLTAVETASMNVMEWGESEVALKCAAGTTLTKVTIDGTEVTPKPSLTQICGDIYKITGGGMPNLSTLNTYAMKPMVIEVEESSTPKQIVLTIPFILTSTNSPAAEPKTAVDLRNLADGSSQDKKNTVIGAVDLVVRNGAQLDVKSEESTYCTFKDLYIYPGGKVHIDTKDLGAKNVYMRGGFSWLDVSKDYRLPQMLVENGKTISGIGSSGHGVYYDLYLDNAMYYMTAFPKDVLLSAVTNEEGTADWTGWVKGYSGEGRTLNPKESGWKYAWEISPGTTLYRGRGYEIAIKPRYKGAMNGRTIGILRFPLLQATAWSDEATPEITVTAWGMTDGVLNEGITANNAGWNYIGNPYFSSFRNTDANGQFGTNMEIRNLKERKPDGEHWDGKYEWVTDGTVKYITVPDKMYENYTDVKAKNYEIEAFFPFFIQASATGSLTFTGSKILRAPAFNQASVPAREVEIDFTLSDQNGKTDNAGLVVSDDYSAEFDMDDKEKTIVNENFLKIYTMVGTYRTAYNSLPENAAKLPIPVGYIAPAEGKYTFALDDEDYSQVEHVWLTDYEKNVTVDLLDDVYEFQTAKGTNNTRLALNIILKPEQETPTGVEDIDDGQWTMDNCQKILFNDHIYIIRGGVIYDATGKRVMEINK